MVGRRGRDGRAGLEKVEESRPDLVVLDLTMPGMDGFDFVADLRSRQGGDLPILVTTARDLSAEDQPGSRQGPVDPPERFLTPATNSWARSAEVASRRSGHARPSGRRPRPGGRASRPSPEPRRHAQDPAGRGQRDEPRHALATARPPRVRGRDRHRRAPGLVSRGRRLRPDPDGPEPAGDRRLGSDPTAQGRPRHAGPDHCPARTRWRATASGAIEAGCDDYDIKPVEFPRLLAKIEAGLRDGPNPGSRNATREPSATPRRSSATT